MKLLLISWNVKNNLILSRNKTSARIVTLSMQHLSRNSNLLKNLFSAFIIFACLACTSTSEPAPTQENQWDLSLQIDEGKWIPARISFTEKDGTQILHIINAGDTIILEPNKISEDTTYYRFIDY